MGRLNTKQKYIYQVSSVNNFEYNLNSYLGMRFYDTGLTTNENVKIYYNEANTLAIWGYYISVPETVVYWQVTTIANIGNSAAPTFTGPQTEIGGKPIGTYDDIFNEFDPPPNSNLVISEIPSKLKISIKKQNLTSLKVGGGTTVNNPSSVYVFKGGSINTLADIFNPINFQVNDTILITSLGLFLNDDYDFIFQVDDHGDGKYWRNEQTNMNNYVIPVNYIIYFNTSNNNNIQVSNGAIIQKYNSGKISLFFDTLPLNTQSIRLNLGYELDGCGNDFVLTQNGVWSQSQNGCDYFLRWDNKNGALPYRWRLFYTNDGRTDRASHPTAGPDSLPKKGWSNRMTISII
jgi:hypothetical protein